MDSEPRRRQDDCISYRDMVEYVSEVEVKFHSIRAESLIQISNTLEKMEARFEAHEQWHRTVLERMLTDRRNTGISVISLIIAALAVLSTLLVHMKG